MIGQGKIKFEKNKLNITGNINSEKLDVEKISKILAFINQPLKRKNIYPVKTMLPKIDINMKLNIDKMIAKKLYLRTCYSEILVNEDNIFLKIQELINKFNNKSKCKIFDSYKKLKGKISIFDYLVEDKLVGNSEFYLKDASFDWIQKSCYEQKNKTIFRQILYNRECISANANIVGINLNKISEES